MLTKRIREFWQDDSGTYTIWSLIWFMLYVAIGGLTVDGTDAYRNMTLLQATADASALAGVMSIGVTGEDPVTIAENYAVENMDPDLHGTVLADADVHIGTWDFDAEKFIEKSYDYNDPESYGDVNAVYVVTRKDEGNGNPVIMSMLRILQGFGLNAWWNIETAAVAVKYIPSCLTNNGLVAYNKVDVTSNNEFNNICIHAQNAYDDPGQNYAIDINNGNVIGPGTQFSMPDTADFNDRPNVCTMNTGLCDEGVIVQGSMPPFDAFVVDDMIQGYETQAIVPEYMYATNPITGEIVTNDSGKPLLKNRPVAVPSAENYPGPYLPYTIYDMNCSSPNKQVSLPDSVLITKVVIVSDCQIGGPSGVQLSDVVLATNAKGNGIDPLAQNSINFPSDLQIGDSSFCDDSTGQVFMLSSASMHVAAGPTVYGLRMVAGGDIQFSAQNSVYGISAEAGNNITATANGTWEYCAGKLGGPFQYAFRLVR